MDLGDPIGRLSRMDAIGQQQMILSARKQMELESQQIEAALERIAAGNYGLCLNCEAEINPKRLKVKPEAPLCLRCQGKSESQ